LNSRRRPLLLCHQQKQTQKQKHLHQWVSQRRLPWRPTLWWCWRQRWRNPSRRGTPRRRLLAPPYTRPSHHSNQRWIEGVSPQCRVARAVRVFARRTTRAPLRRIQSQTNEMTHHKRTRRRPRAMRRRGTCGRARVVQSDAHSHQRRTRMSSGTRTHVHRACKLVCERYEYHVHTRVRIAACPMTVAAR
jgi:hypothetical protein